MGRLLKRWAKQLTERKPQHLSVQGALVANRATIAGWFDAVTNSFKKIKLIWRGRASPHMHSTYGTAVNWGFV